MRVVDPAGIRPPADRSWAREDGAVLVWVALMSVVLLGVAAFAVDLGYAYSVKRQLSATADSAALAGAQQGGMMFRSTGGCPGGSPTSQLRAEINAAVAANHAANGPQGTTVTPVPTITCDAKQITVAVTESSTLNSFFGRVFGVSTLNPVESATANVFGANIQGGLRPFTVCLSDARSGAVSPFPTRESIYVQHNKPPTSEVRIGNGQGSDWSSASDAIFDRAHGLVSGDVVRIEIVSGLAGINPGLYYVVSPTTDTFKLSSTLNGIAINVTADGKVKVFKQTTGLVSGGGSTWESDNETITATAHGLAAGNEVRLVIRSGATGATSGEYFVLSATANTLTVSATRNGAVQAISADGVVDVYKIVRDATPGACNPTLAPGNWGYARFDLGGDQPTLECLIEFGYGGDPGCRGTGVGTNLGDDDPATPEVTSPGNTGNSLQVPPSPQGQNNSDLLAMMRALVDQTILLPVAEVWTEQGQNANYTAKGGVAVKFCGFIFTKSNNDPSVSARGGPGSCWQESMFTNAVAAGKLSDAVLYIQWQYVDKYVGSYIGQGSGSGQTCNLGDPTCIPALRLIE